VDVFDALVSARPYKAAFPLEKALTILETGAGSQFDPTFAATFIGIVPALHETVADLPPQSVLPHLENLRRRHFGV
jgi:HD-GYP domain-containing protein (c-di-GMP phosphodiesterase class II)